LVKKFKPLIDICRYNAAGLLVWLKRKKNREGEYLLEKPRV